MAAEKESWMNLSCLIADADRDVLRQCPRLDRMTVGTEAVMLSLVGIVAITVWYLFFASFLPWTTALPAGFLVGFMIFMLDRRVASSDWTLTGVLSARTRPSLLWCAKFAMRVGVALAFATVTATGVLLALYSDTLTELLRKDQIALNVEVQRKYDGIKKEAWDVIVSPRKEEFDNLAKQDKYLREQLQEQDKTLSDATRQSAASQIEMSREREGGLPGYLKGEGPRFKDAQMHLQIAQQARTTATNERTQTSGQLSALVPLLTAAADRLAKANKEYVQAERRIDEQMRRDSDWQGLKNGPLSRWMALDRLRKDPEEGAAVAKFDLAAKTTLIGLELSFLFLKMLFSPASEYHMRLSRRTKQNAAREISEYREALRALRTPSSAQQRPVMRLVSSMRQEADPGERGRPGDTWPGPHPQSG